MPLAFAVSIRLYKFALPVAPDWWPRTPSCFCPSQTGGSHSLQLCCRPGTARLPGSGSVRPLMLQVEQGLAQKSLRPGVRNILFHPAALGFGVLRTVLPGLVFCELLDPIQRLNKCQCLIGFAGVVHGLRCFALQRTCGAHALSIPAGSASAWRRPRRSLRSRRPSTRAAISRQAVAWQHRHCGWARSDTVAPVVRGNAAPT